jgi:hypothetical protein
MSGDSINPAHYRSHPSGIECVQITEHMGFCLGNAVKYVWRADLKHDDGGIEDLKKAAWYIARELERRQNAQNTPTPATTPETDTRPAEPPQKDAEGGLRVGARVKVRDTYPGAGNTGTLTGDHEATGLGDWWTVAFDDGTKTDYFGWALEVIA